MVDLFISYASDDRTEAERLANYLEDQGYVVWWDRDLIAGEDFHATIERMIEDCKAAIVIWSDSSIESRWVLGEAETAANARKLIPVRLDSLTPSKLPIAFRALQTPVLSDRAGLLNAIKQRLDRPGRQKRAWDIFITRVTLRLRHLRRRLTPGRVAIAGVLIAAVGYLGLDFLNWVRIRDSVEIEDFKQHQQRFRVDMFSRMVARKIAGESEWQGIERSKLATELRAFIERYPESVYAGFAQLRLGRLEAIAAGRYNPLIPNSSTRPLSSGELQPLQCDQLWTARNEILYALGYCFVTKTAIDAFRTSADCPRSCKVVKTFNGWIYDRVESVVERSNINLIQAVEGQNHCNMAHVPGPCDSTP